MARALAAGLTYLAVIFAAGFAFGAVREIWVVPRTGPFWPRIAEIPVMVLLSWFAARRIVAGYGLAHGRARLVMGLSAFAGLMVLEALVARLAFGRGLGEHVAAYLTLQGGLTLAAQSAFALLPCFVRPPQTPSR